MIQNFMMKSEMEGNVRATEKVREMMENGEMGGVKMMTGKR